jgi:hypothetical protein
MKLARTTFFVIFANDRGVRRNDRGLVRPRATRTSDLGRSSNRLVASWRVHPETHRLECSWSLEPAASDDQLFCRATRRHPNRSYLRSSKLSFRRNRSPLSRARYGLL